MSIISAPSKLYNLSIARKVPNRAIFPYLSYDSSSTLLALDDFSRGANARPGIDYVGLSANAISYTAYIQMCGAPAAIHSQ
jgi:hypothetical protein